MTDSFAFTKKNAMNIVPGNMLTRYPLDLLYLPKTNGKHCTIVVIKMMRAVGARTVDLETQSCGARLSLEGRECSHA